MLVNILFPVDLLDCTSEDHASNNQQQQQPQGPISDATNHDSIMTTTRRRASRNLRSSKDHRTERHRPPAKSKCYLLLGHGTREKSESQPSSKASNLASISVSAILEIDESYMRTGPNGGSDLLSKYCRNGADTTRLLNVVGIIIPHNFPLSFERIEKARLEQLSNRQGNPVYRDSQTRSMPDNSTLCERLAKASEYFLLIRKCNNTACHHVKLSSTGTPSYVTPPKARRSTCSGHCIVFMDHMNHSVRNENITMIYHDPNQLLRAHLLRSTVARATGCSAIPTNAPSNSTNSVRSCRYPDILRFLFISIEKTYCALITHESDHQLRKASLSGCHSGNNRSTNDQCTKLPLALFCMDLVATSADHHEHLLRVPNCLDQKFETNVSPSVVTSNSSTPMRSRCTSQPVVSSAQISRDLTSAAFKSTPTHSSERSLTFTNINDTKYNPHDATDSGSPGNIATWLMQSCIKSSCAGRQIFVRLAQLEQCYLMFRSTQMSVWLKRPTRPISSVPSSSTSPAGPASNMAQKSADATLRHHQLSTVYPVMTMAASETYASVALDIALGFIVTMLLMLFVGPEDLFDIAMRHALSVVDTIQRLLLYLMDMPVGLKLNLSLNQALGRFFLYHFYLWKTFVTIIRPCLAIAIQALMLTGLLGLSCLLSVLCDLLAVITIHIYCFHGYAARFHNLQINGLIALWRLFRGKKWNMLRHRVDSHHYGTDQLFVGTLTFTILIFLMPTILTYYLVFFILRAATRGLQTAIRSLYECLTVMPINTIVLWLISSRKIASQVIFLSLMPSESCAETNHIIGVDGEVPDAYPGCRHTKGAEIYLTPCIESIDMLLTLRSQSTRENLKLWYNTKGIQKSVLVEFSSSVTVSTSTDRTLLTAMLNKLLFGELF